MATRLRKTRRLRGGRHMGWGQVGQHRASGHQGGLGMTGLMKHHYSTLLKDYPDHYGHSSTRPPHPNVTKKWAGVRDLDDLFERIGTLRQGKDGGGSGQADNNNPAKFIDLTAAGYEKLLGGGSVSTAYTVRVRRHTASAGEKVRAAGGIVIQDDAASPQDGDKAAGGKDDNNDSSASGNDNNNGSGEVPSKDG